MEYNLTGLRIAFFVLTPLFTLIDRKCTGSEYVIKTNLYNSQIPKLFEAWNRTKELWKNIFPFKRSWTNDKFASFAFCYIRIYFICSNFNSNKLVLAIRFTLWFSSSNGDVVIVLIILSIFWSGAREWKISNRGARELQETFQVGHWCTRLFEFTFWWFSIRILRNEDKLKCLKFTVLCRKEFVTWSWPLFFVFKSEKLS